MISQIDLKYFAEIAKTNHLSRAAERLGVTQPALSHSIKRIESTLGHEILLRSKKGVTLTPAGCRLLEQSQALIHLWDQVVRSAHDETGKVAGTIRIGCHTAVAQYTLPHFLPKFLKAHPHLKLQLIHGLSRHMTESVVSGQLDAAIVINPTPHPDLVIKELGRDVVTVWKALNCVNPDLLLIEPNILQTQHITTRLQKAGKTFNRIIECTSLEVIAQLLASGTGCAILPERVAHAFSPTSKIAPLAGAPQFHDRICLIFKPEFKKLKRGAVFASALAESFG